MTPSLPLWVSKRDGRREPFDSDKISQSLYAATEATGSPNAFLARELTDGVVHFLGQENIEETIATEQIAELVEKVVRELGHPGLAQKFLLSRTTTTDLTEVKKRYSTQLTIRVDPGEDSDEALGRFLEQWDLQTVFSRDLIAAEQAKLLWLPQCLPRLLDKSVVEPIESIQSIPAWRMALVQVREASRRAGYIAVDGAEWFVAAHGPSWLEGFVAALDAYGGRAVLNLHLATPPAWASQAGSAPLFPGGAEITDATRQRALTTILDALMRDQERGWGVNWHIQSADFEDPSRAALLSPLLGQSDALRWTTFTLDRSRRPVLLARGLDRNHPAVALRVGLSLPDFFKYSGIDCDGVKMIGKLPSLARMAVSAGVQKRAYLRRHRQDLARGFLVDRAPVLIEPLDLEKVVAMITGVRPSKSQMAVHTARSILQSLHEAAEQAGRAAGLEVVVANFQGVWVDEIAEGDEREPAWRAAGAVLEVIDSGQVYVRLAQASPDAVWQHLRHAWRTPGITQVHFACP